MIQSDSAGTRQFSSQDAVKGEADKLRVPRFWIIKKEHAVSCLLFYLFLNIYLELPLGLWGEKVLPAFPYILLIPLLVVWFRNSVLKRDIVFIRNIFLFLLFSAIISLGREYIAFKLVGVIQTTVSIIGGVLMFRIIVSSKIESLDAVLLAIWGLLLVGSLLEIVGLINGISDSFRNWAYSVGGYGRYSDTERDLAMYYWVRPRFFSSEPSLVAIGFMVFINSWLLLKQSDRRFMAALFFSLGALAVIGSPIIVLSFAMSIAIYLENKRHTFTSKRLGIVGMALVLSIATFFFGDRVAERFYPSNFGNEIGVDSSVNIRLFIPLVTATTVIQESPLFGIGISGKKVAANILDFQEDNPSLLVSNNVFAFIAYFGIVGGAILLLLFKRYFRAVGLKRQRLILLMGILIGFAMGGIESPRYLGYIFLFAAALWHADNKMKSDRLT